MPHLLEKNQKISLFSILAVSGGVFGKIDLCLDHVVPFIYAFCTLPEACQQIIVNPYFICLGLAKFFKAFPNCVQAEVFLGQAPGHILVHPKILTLSYNFLAFLKLCECCKLTF